MAAYNVPILIKQPDEVRTATFRFTKKLNDDDTLTGSATMVYASGLTEVATSRSGNIVLSRMSGGTAGTTYRVTCRCATTNGDTLELDLDVYVNADYN